MLRSPKITEPLETLPGSSIKFIIAFPTVLFPEPDSPTKPKISPLFNYGKQKIWKVQITYVG